MKLTITDCDGGTSEQEIDEDAVPPLGFIFQTSKGYQRVKTVSVCGDNAEVQLEKID